MSKIFSSADQLIGRTPLLELTRIERAEKLEARILAKKAPRVPTRSRASARALCRTC